MKGAPQSQQGPPRFERSKYAIEHLLVYRAPLDPATILPTRANRRVVYAIPEGATKFALCSLQSRKDLITSDV